MTSSNNLKYLDIPVPLDESYSINSLMQTELDNNNYGFNYFAEIIKSHNICEFKEYLYKYNLNGVMIMYINAFGNEEMNTYLKNFLLLKDTKLVKYL